MTESNDYWWKNHAVTHCPNCVNKMKTVDTSPYHRLGYPSNRRRKYCSNCDFATNTVEIPMVLANQHFLTKEEKQND